MHDQITVQLAAGSYPLYLHTNANDTLPEVLRKHLGARRYVLITNATLALLFQEQIAQWQSDLGFSIITIADGERHKNLQSWQLIMDRLLESRLDRKTVILALGGGVVGDIAGFSAATFLRGIDIVQIPTTLLAMVDSSVGGKTGVNHPMGKNLIGAFHQPRLVWIDTCWLTTLSPREFLCGYGELFKYAFIGGPSMFEFVKTNDEAMRNRDPALLWEGIKRSVTIKAEVVAADEHETSGKRALLNFGHTFGHAIEHYFHFEGVLHGEAVLWGIACAHRLGLIIGSIPAAHHATYQALIDQMRLPALPAMPDPVALYAAMFSDKKTEDGFLRFVVPLEPGNAQLRSGINKEAVMETMQAVFKNSN